VNIRPMLIEDYDEVYKLWSGTAEMGMRSLDDSLDGIAKFLNRNTDTSFVAQEEKQLVGVILCGHDGRRGYIYHTAVKPDYRKRGIGKALVVAALDALKKEQINKAALVVYNTNDLGNNFWESIGFGKKNDLVYRNISMNEKNF
jgi:ribosomal protein S18 acetylase RimI-like enzyme